MDAKHSSVNEATSNAAYAPDSRRYTYADYALLSDDKRYEVIDGVLYLMAPAPSVAHQDVGGELFVQLKGFLRGNPCKVFHAPFDVCLNAAGDDDVTVVQPDILVVCDRSKLDGKRCNGAPDFVIEILSPSSAARDTMLKFHKYMYAGVREYWIVDPIEKIVQVCILKGGRYETEALVDPDAIPVRVLQGCRIDMKQVFAQQAMDDGTDDYLCEK